MVVFVVVSSLFGVGQGLLRSDHFLELPVVYQELSPSAFPRISAFFQEN